MNTLILDRIVCDQKLTRKKYTWWRYTIENDYITIVPLKSELPSLDSIILSLIRDIEFIKNYLSIRFYINKNISCFFNIDSGYKFYFLKEKQLTYSYLSVEEEGNKLLHSIKNIPIEHFLHILAKEYPNLIKLKTKGDKSYYKLFLQNENKKLNYLKNFNTLFESFKSLNFDKKINFFVSKHYGGFEIKNRKLKLYAYENSYDWYKPIRMDGSTFYDYLRKKCSSNFRKIYILFYSNKHHIGQFSDKNLKKFLKEIKKIFIENGCKFN